jgi:hypothetical protein
MNVSEGERAGHRVPALLVLCLAQAVGATGLAAGSTAGPLLVVRATGSGKLGPLPLGFLVVGAALAGPLGTAAMLRWGRARGLAGCYLAATAGAALVVFGFGGGLAPLLVGNLLLGAGNEGVMLGRYVAADVAMPGRQPQAIGLAVGAVTAGAVAGPALLGPAGAVAGALGLPAPEGLYLLALAGFPVAGLISLRLGRGGSRPEPRKRAPRTGFTGRAGPLVVLGVANLSMVSVMGAAPDHLQHHGAGLASVGLMIAVHIGAMYAPAPVSGALCRRLGPVPVATAGLALMLIALLLAMTSGGFRGDLAMLVVLGAAWNLQLVGGSAWLVDTVAPSSRHRAEGMGEFVMGAAAAAGTLGAAAPLLAFGGLPALCVALAIANVLGCAIALAVSGRA